MELLDRYNADAIRSDLAKKMVFLGGPRQVGKTTLAENLLRSEKGALLNWDDDEDREQIISREFPLKKGLLVFDELHKNRKWRNYLKGLFDKRKGEYRILVTGSARLDLYRFGGDSLQGRYYYHRLHPLSVKELRIESQSDLDTLLVLSGFPEPFFAQNEQEKLRWTNSYRTSLVRDDLRDLERVVDLSALDLLSRRLPALVGSPLSINALREDLGVAHRTLVNWLEIFERLYFIYRIPPFGPPNIRAVKKLTKHYHFDWSLPPSPGARFENLVAGHLLKWIHHEEDVSGRVLELRYYRDSQDREIDFVVLERQEPILFVEAKLSESKRPTGLGYLKSRYPNARAIALCKETRRHAFADNGIELIDALTFLKELV